MTTLTRRDQQPASTAAQPRRAGWPLYLAVAGTIALVSGLGYRIGEASTGRPGIAASVMHPLAWWLVQLGNALLVVAAVGWRLRRGRAAA
ncbi:MAG TPA: hypothetical protein VJT31_39725 [Rugosimonospora sp.]|nr:hypothetical protein [Rugosimonospora sp.]